LGFSQVGYSQVGYSQVGYSQVGYSQVGYSQAGFSLVCFYYSYRFYIASIKSKATELRLGVQVLHLVPDTALTSDFQLSSRRMPGSIGFSGARFSA